MEWKAGLYVPGRVHSASCLKSPQDPGWKSELCQQIFLGWLNTYHVCQSPLLTSSPLESCWETGGGLPHGLAEGTAQLFEGQQ